MKATTPRHLNQQVSYFEKTAYDERFNWQTQDPFVVAHEKGTLRPLIDALQEGIAKHKSIHVLESGCGEGANLELLLQEKNLRDNVHFFGIDPCEPAVQYAHQKHLGNIQQGDGLRLPWPDAFFDATFCRDVLHHLQNHDEQTRFVQEMLRVTKPTGTVIAIEPNAKNPCIFFQSLILPAEKFVRHTTERDVINLTTRPDVIRTAPSALWRVLLNYRMPHSIRTTIERPVKSVLTIWEHVARHLPSSLWSYRVYRWNKQKHLSSVPMNPTSSGLNKKLPIIICASVCVLSLVASFFTVQKLKTYGDPESYFAAFDFIEGKSTTVRIDASNPMVISRLLASPLLIRGSVLIGAVTHGARTGMLIINILFYLAICYLFFHFANMISHNEWTATIAVTLVTTNYEFLYSGLAYMADIGGWFFFLLSSFFAIKFYNEPKRNALMVYSALAASIGLLFKENGGFGFVTLLVAIAAIQESWTWKIKKAFQSGFLALCLPVIYHIYFYFQYHFSYLDWYRFVHYQYLDKPTAGATLLQRIIQLIKVSGWVFLPGWPLALYGIARLKQATPEIKRAILLFLPASLCFLAWPTQVQRLAFVLVPWLCLVSANGLWSIRNKYLVVALVTVTIVINFNLQALMNGINLPF